MRFVIDRSKWRCGGGEVLDSDGRVTARPPHARGVGYVTLLNGHGFMCCLGMISEQCGVPLGCLQNVAQPEEIYEPEVPRVVPLLAFMNRYGHYELSDLGGEAIGINDDCEIDDATREQRLKDLFSRHGHEIVFTGEYVIPAQA